MRELAHDPTADFAVTPLVGSRVREFIESRSDFDRSLLLGRIIIPLVLVLLIERELFAAAGRPGARAFFAYGVPLASCLALLILVRLRRYLG